MCVILHLPPKVTLSKKLLENCYKNNPDGFGIMAAIDGKIQTVKSLGNFDDFLREYKQFPRDIGRAVHFRIATRGSVTLENCHPFKVTDNLYLMHNGTIDRIEVDEKNKRSDSFHFAEEELRAVVDSYGQAPLMNPLWIKAIEKCTAGNKVLLMDNNGLVDYTFENLWHQEYGVMFSHSRGHEAPYVKAKHSSFWKGQTDWDAHDRKWKVGKYSDDPTVRRLWEDDSGIPASDLTPYGMNENGDYLYGGLDDYPESTLESQPMTIADLYKLSYEELYDFVTENPDAATDLMTELMTRPLVEMGVA